MSAPVRRTALLLPLLCALALPCHAATPAPKADAISAAAFESTVTGPSGDRPVLVEFYTDECPACREFKPVLAAAEQHYGDRISVVRVDVDANPGLSERFSIRAIPTVILFDAGTAVHSKRGAMTTAELDAFVERHLEP